MKLSSDGDAYENAETSLSSSDDDEFDSEDERVRCVLGQSTEQNPSQAAKDSSHTHSSSESDGEEGTTIADMQQPVNAAQQQNSETFESDAESDYDTESSSDTEAMTPKAPERIVQETSVRSMEPPRPSKKKPQEVETQKSPAENDELTQNANRKSMKQQKKDLAGALSANGELLETLQQSQTVKNVHGAAVDIASDGSVRNDRSSGLSAKKRKLEWFQEHTGRDSTNSNPIVKKNSDAEGMETRAVKQKVLKNSRDTGTNKPSASNKVAGKDNPFHDYDAMKELSKKTLNSVNARETGSAVSVGMKTMGTRPNLINQPTASSKQKKLPHVWSVDEEIALACEILNIVKMGFDVPSKRNDDLWAPLSDILQEKLDVKFSEEQLSEKVRRLKQKYQSALQKLEQSRGSKKPFKLKNRGDKELFDIISQIWGRTKIMNLEDPKEGENNRKDSNKFTQTTPDRKVKRAGLGLPKPRVSPNAGTCKAAENAMGNGEDTNGSDIMATSPGPERGQVLKVDPGTDILHPPADESTLLLNNVDRLLQRKIHASLKDLQEWTKQTLNEWMTKADARIENSVKRLANQVQCASMISMVDRGLPLSVGNPLQIQFVQGDGHYQMRWQELRLQELNVYRQRLELMRRECELKQEQLKVHLQQTLIPK